MTRKGLRIRTKTIQKDIKKLITEGVIDGHTCSTFEKALIDTIKKNFIKIILDFTKLNYLSSAGIGVLLAEYAKITDDRPDNRGKIVVINASEGVRDVFKILGIEDSFGFVGSEKEALEILNA